MLMDWEISKMLSHGDMDTQGLFNSRRFRDNREFASVLN